MAQSACLLPLGWKKHYLPQMNNQPGLSQMATNGLSQQNTDYCIRIKGVTPKTLCGKAYGVCTPQKDCVWNIETLDSDIDQDSLQASLASSPVVFMILWLCSPAVLRNFDQFVFIASPVELSESRLFFPSYALSDFLSCPPAFLHHLLDNSTHLPFLQASESARSRGSGVGPVLARTKDTVGASRGRRGRVGSGARGPRGLEGRVESQG